MTEHSSRCFASGVFAFVVPVIALASACSSSDAVAPSSATDGGVSVPAGCDLTADAKDAPLCVVDAVGRFVDSQSGDDANDGSRAHPVRTVGAALGKLAGHARVYVCGAGPYTEPVVVSAQASASIYGGFTCSTWEYSGTRAVIAPADQSLPLGIANTTTALVFADLELDANDGVGPGASSFGAFVLNAAQVTFRRMLVNAGRGIAGTDGAPAYDFFPYAAPAGVNGSAGGTSLANPRCPSSVGGAGYQALTGGGRLDGTVARVPAYPAGCSGRAGGTMNDGYSCTPASEQCGSYGKGGAGGAGALSLGTIDIHGWKGGDGTPGTAGTDGQGGGGGAGLQLDPGTNPTTSGGGGPGGCGGSGGAAGTAGGSSIAVLAYQSSVTFESSQLVARDAGRGGNGGNGQKAQLASTINSTATSGDSSCPGGIGGIGGSGGGGGGAAGGISVGVLFSGTAPMFDGAVTTAKDVVAGVTVGTAGPGGLRGAGGAAAQPTGTPSESGQPGGDGVPGRATAVLDVP